MRKSRSIKYFAAVAVTAITPMLGMSAVAQAEPTVDPVSALVEAGVPTDIAESVDLQQAAASEVVTIAHPGYTNRFIGTQVDAAIDRDAGTVTVLQRNLAHEASQLRVGWVNLSNGKSGISGLPDAVDRVDWEYGVPVPTVDRAATLPTGGGPVALVVFGSIPGWTGLIPLAPEYFGILTPAGTVLNV